MELKLLQTHLRTLAALEVTDAPVISCYLSLAEPPKSYRQELDERVQTLRAGLSGRVREHLRRHWLPSKSISEPDCCPTLGARRCFLAEAPGPSFCPCNSR
jgi:hypothetical protein